MKVVVVLISGEDERLRNTLQGEYGFRASSGQ